MTSANFKINVQEYINEIVVEEGRNSPWNGVLKLLPGCKEIKKITITMNSDIEWLYVWHILCKRTDIQNKSSFIFFSFYLLTNLIDRRNNLQVNRSQVKHIYCI